MRVSAQTNGLLAATWSNYLVDVIIILFIAGLTILCAKRGFVECVFDFASTLLSFFVAILLARLVIFITGGLFGFEKWLGGAFAKSFIKVDGFDAVLSSDGAKDALMNKNVAGVIVNLAVRWFAKGKVASGTTIAGLLGNITAKLFTLLIMSVILFVVAKLLLYLTKKILTGIIERITLLDAANTAIGAVIGFSQALLIVGAVLAVFAVIPSPPIDNYLSNCIFLGWMYEYNPVIALLGLLI
ncbi:MAG: CvpA family protein [Clostridia bacterium]|nr:CvpA family protein [Clostridia bacterium]